jgi:hypothetical protein
MSKSGIKRILVPLDGSKNSIRGLDNAIYLARQCQATIIGIYVLARVPVRAYRAIQYPEKELLKDADSNMEYAKKHCAQNGIVFEKKISFGDPGYTIVKYAKDKKRIKLCRAQGKYASFNCQVGRSSGLFQTTVYAIIFLVLGFCSFIPHSSLVCPEFCSESVPHLNFGNCVSIILKDVRV